MNSIIRFVNGYVELRDAINWEFDFSKSGNYTYKCMVFSFKSVYPISHPLTTTNPNLFFYSFFKSQSYSHHIIAAFQHSFFKSQSHPHHHNCCLPIQPTAVTMPPCNCERQSSGIATLLLHQR